MSEATRRTAARAVIARVRDEHPEAVGAELRRLLFDAYPWGPRSHWPYRVWCDEVRFAVERDRETWRRDVDRPRNDEAAELRAIEASGQARLFELEEGAGA